jgi:hypothetical protein
MTSKKINYSNEDNRAAAHAITGGLTLACFILSTITSGLCLYLISDVILNPITSYLWAAENPFLNFLSIVIIAAAVVLTFGFATLMDYCVNRLGNAFFSELFVISTNKVKYTWQRVIELLAFGFLGGACFFGSYATSRYGSDVLSTFVKVGNIEQVKEQKKATNEALEPYKDALKKAEGDLKDELVILMGAKKYKEFANGTSTSTRIEFKESAAAVAKKHQKFIDNAKMNLQTAETQFVTITGQTTTDDINFMQSIKAMASKVGTIPLWIALVLIALRNLKNGDRVRRIFEKQNAIPDASQGNGNNQQQQRQQTRQSHNSVF